MFVYYALVEDNRGPLNTYGISFGAIYIFGTIIFGPYTGACINPLRILGPALVNLNMKDVMVYCVGSLAGCLFGSFYY